MTDLVLSFTPQGQVQGMHMDTFDLGFLGSKHIERATEIKFDEATQLWGLFLPRADGSWVCPSEDAKGFPTYETAREAEVLWLNVCRVRGEDPEGAYGLTVIRKIKAGISSGNQPAIEHFM